MRRALAALLALGAGLLAWATLEERARVATATPAAPRASSAPAVIDAQDEPGRAQVPVLPDLATLTETIERPLFREGRRPAEQESAPVVSVAPSAPADPPRVSLSGIVIVDQRPVAMLRAADGARRVGVGDTVEGWRVSAILADQIQFTRGGAQHVVELRKYDALPPSAPAPRTMPARPGPSAAAPADGQPGREEADPAAAVRPRRPRLGPRQAARERLQRRRATADE